MTDEERREGMKRLKSIEVRIKELEAHTNVKILACSSIISDNSSDIVCFTGHNEIRYELPYQVFMTIPEKRIIIEVSRALTIEFNDYGQ